MATGKIKFFKEDKRFGFIAGDDGQDYFVHIKNIRGGKTPVTGAKVTYKLRQGQKGQESYDVTIEGTSLTPSIPTSQVAPAPSGQASFPYSFVRRKGGKVDNKAFHHHLENGHLDVALDVTWTTETPTALAPCEDPSRPETATGHEGENNGYNKRWLMLDGKPAISPFTVKGAVANGIANILGGCYRVPDQDKGHNSSLNAGTYPYTGKWKRYRVSMNGKSLPGIIQYINAETGQVTVQPVIEYYWDQPQLPFELKSGDQCHADWRVDRRRNLIQQLYRQGGQGRVYYYGPYRFGMNLMLLPGDMNKQHHHRFYSMSGMELTGNVPQLSMVSEENLLKKVYGGMYCKGELKELKVQRMRHHLGKPWYDDPSSLKKGDWCYYTLFEDSAGVKRISAIGKNFQFKALFNHEDTIPAHNITCNDVDKLCPRCALFGLADKSDNNKKSVVGYAGRFRASALLSKVTLTEAKISGAIPTKETLAPHPVQFSVWRDGEQEIIRQFALPIMGTPKPSKRDMGGYFNEKTGELKGAKRYHHADIDFNNKLPGIIAHTDSKLKTEENLDYGHQMRPIAAVCREGVAFSGTIGGENCTPRETAALLMLLDQRSAEHSFKLGLGKSIGLGSVSSRINRIWIRKNESYHWVSVDIPQDGAREELFAAFRNFAPEVADELKELITSPDAQKKVHPLKDKKQRLEFAKAGLKYWQDSHVETI